MGDPTNYNILTTGLYLIRSRFAYVSYNIGAGPVGPPFPMVRAAGIFQFAGPGLFTNQPFSNGQTAGVHQESIAYADLSSDFTLNGPVLSPTVQTDTMLFAATTGVLPFPFCLAWCTNQSADYDIVCTLSVVKLSSDPSI